MAGYTAKDVDQLLQFMMFTEGKVKEDLLSEVTSSEKIMKGIQVTIMPVTESMQMSPETK